ncbi:HNH endonuclease [Intestinibacter sp.]|uniref:HNH endonuclease n=1 Tax=Intestinibacter sp. TaxID=1965304 RepID=UPI002A74E5A9|nr:HNH endonuclease [Intestinibacter sp.]MDY2735818.1 HNH endonuclease [Intestinibacter sp.]
MQKTVREIIDMINTGKLQYNQSTQRKFVYADIDAQLDCGKTTKSGSLIHSILEYDIQLPAVYFWHNTDTGHLNIHDGKQRLLSLYYFINPTPNINFTTIRNGKAMNFNALSSADQEKLLNYTFDIVERTGTSEEEEKSFYLINTNSVNLTSYECLSGMLHGTFLTQFEYVVEHSAKTMDQVKPIGRGEQAYKLLLTMFDLCDSKKAAGNDKSMLLLCDRIRPLRDNWFDPKSFSFDEILQVFNEFSRVTTVKEDRALAVAAYIVRKNYEADDIINLYRKSMKGINDIGSWDIDTHKTFIDYFVENGYSASLDPKRNFDKEIKDQLYARSNCCAHIDDNGIHCTETNYSKLEVDHITPWSKGGRTILANAQLLCKHHNTSKGNRA